MVQGQEQTNGQGAEEQAPRQSLTRHRLGGSRVEEMGSFYGKNDTGPLIYRLVKSRWIKVRP